MSERNRNLTLRVVSALLLFPAAVFVTVKGDLAFTILCAAVAILASVELMLMFGRLGKTEYLGAAVAGVFSFATWWGWKTHDGFFPESAALVLAVAVVVLLTLNLFRPERELETIHRSVASVFLAWLYCGLLVAVVVSLRLRFGWGWTVLAYCVTWGNDSFAYFAGLGFGKHKMYERISPKKTWEGFAGGMVGSLFGVFLAKLALAPFGELTALAVFPAVVLALGAAVLGPVGDLVESMLKRSTGVKDSGNLIPGHGGILDRVDALLFVAPLVYLFAAATAS
jgi:phosphatidate cytidylyltransferase